MLGLQLQGYRQASLVVRTQRRPFTHTPDQSGDPGLLWAYPPLGGSATGGSWWAIARAWVDYKFGGTCASTLCRCVLYKAWVLGGDGRRPPVGLPPSGGFCDTPTPLASPLPPQGPQRRRPLPRPSPGTLPRPLRRSYYLRTYPIHREATCSFALNAGTAKLL
jgi:hypothetical protein